MAADMQVEQLQVAIFQSEMTPQRLTKCHWEAQFKGGMWWQLPDEVAAFLSQARANGMTSASFVYDWGRKRPNNFRDQDGNTSTLCRYVINFETMVQTNSDSGSVRKVREIFTRD